MAKKNKNNNNDTNKEQQQNETKDNKNNDNQTTPNTVVLKIDMHCEGCTSKIDRIIRRFKGVETVKNDAGKLTITGTVDGSNLRDKLAAKTKKKVDLISPLPKNDKQKPQNDTKNKPDDKKPKPLPVITAVLKMELHCQGCILRIRKNLLKTKGVEYVMVDKEKETVTVKGAIDVKVVVENLSKRLKRKVVVVPAKKENEKDNGDKKKNDDKKGEGGGGGGGKKGENNGGGEGKMEISTSGYGYGYGLFGFGDGYNNGQVQMMQLQAPDMFSDENPNACSVM